MGFERAESPSRVKGSALVGLGKAQKPAGEFRRRRKSTKPDQGDAGMGFERAESPSQVKGSALVGLGKTQKPAGEFR